MRARVKEWNEMVEAPYLSTFPNGFASCAGTPQIR